jgi:TolB-like protein
VALKLSTFLAELKRRKVYRVAIVYAVVGVGVLGAAEVILDPLGLDALRSYIVILVLLGFPVALVLAWAYEVKPEEPHSEEPGAGGAPPPDEPTAAAGTAAADRRKSIVVLPFDNMSPAPGDAYFADGLTEEIITKLSYLRSLRVISRNSAMVLKGSQKSTRAIAEELGVQFVLEGSVRKAGESLRITAQLIDAAADEHLWAESYDRDLEDVFRVQTDVAENIARALRTELSETEQERIRRVPTRNMRAYEFYVRSKRAGEGGILPQHIAEGAELAREAIRLDPEFAHAYAGLAEFYAASGFYANERPSDLFPRLEAAATKAMELDPHAGEPHVAMAVIRHFHEWDWAGAEEELARALELSPDYSGAYRWKATFLLCAGRFGEAEATIGRGLALDPFAADAYTVLGEILAFSGRPREAIRVLESAATRWPIYALLHFWLGVSHLYSRDPEAALPPIDRAIARSGAIPFFESIRGIVLAALGRMDEAGAVLEELKGRSDSEYVDPYTLFCLAEPLDGFDAAVPYLEEALEVRSYFLPFLGVVPRFRPLHGDSRFQAVLEKVWPGVSFEA